MKINRKSHRKVGAATRTVAVAVARGCDDFAKIDQIQ